MKTIEINLFQFDELSEKAKQKAIRNFRENGVSTDYIYDEVHESVKAFNSVFGTKEGRREWTDFSTSDIDDNILELSGLRLRTYILNNFGSQIFTKKYLKTGENSTKRPKYHKMRKVREINSGPNKGLFYSQYYSNIRFDCDCPFTGVCYDMDLLDPVLKFLKWGNPKECSNTTFADLLEDCFFSLRKSIENEVDYLHSDEAIIENIKSDGLEFTEDGSVY